MTETDALSVSSKKEVTFDRFWTSGPPFLSSKAIEIPLFTWVRLTWRDLILEWVMFSLTLSLVIASEGLPDWAIDWKVPMV